jgi:ferric-dicitrate binding protein FerR (iron transport regulator)
MPDTNDDARRAARSRLTAAQREYDAAINAVLAANHGPGPNAARDARRAARAAKTPGVAGKAAGVVVGGAMLVLFTLAVAFGAGWNATKAVWGE